MELSLSDEGRPLIRPKRKRCECVGKDPWTIALVVITLIVVILLATVAIVTVAYNSDQFAVTRYCFQTGAVTLNVNDRSVSWYIQYNSSLAPVTTLFIMGPILPGMATSNTIKLALCGSPSTVSCITTTANVLQYSIAQVYPGGSSPVPIMNDINDKPYLYYVTINNVTIGTMGTGC
jgi:hypothetical protein